MFEENAVKRLGFSLGVIFSRADLLHVTSQTPIVARLSHALFTVDDRTNND